MNVFVVYANCSGESYHKAVLATLDREQAEKVMNDFNAAHPDIYDVQYDMDVLSLEDPKGKLLNRGIQVGNLNHQVNVL